MVTNAHNKGLSTFVKGAIFLLFVVLDLFLIGAFITATAAWLFAPLLIENETVRIVVHFAWPVFAVLLIALVLRIAARKLINRNLYETKGPLDFSAVQIPCYILVGGVALLAVFEGILIAAEIEEPLPAYVAQDDADSQLKTGGFIEPDPELLWKFAAGSNYTHGVINELGFPGKAPAAEKPPATTRVICLGGTTTCAASPAYPEMLETAINTSGDLNGQAEVLNFAVERYSIAQGLKVWKNIARKYQPDYVVLYFGWDDHWRAAAPDSTRMAERLHTPAQSWFAKMGKRRFIQLIANNKLNARNQARRNNPHSLRVPLDEYEWTLRTLIKDIQASGAEPVLIIPDGQDLPASIVTRGLAADMASIDHLHKAYNQVSLEVATETKCTVVNMVEFIKTEVATRFALANEEPVPLFEENGIVLTHKGRTFLVELLQLKIH